MGGFFSSPSPPPAPPPIVVAPAVDTSAADAAQARQDAIDRNRRGRAGLVATSDSGVLTPPPAGAPATGNSLLGD